MALYASIRCGEQEIELAEDVVVSYRFKYRLGCAYAKKYPESIGVTLELDVSEILSGESGTLEENERLLESLREWGRQVYRESEADAGYYRMVRLRHTFGGEVFRDMVFSHAYVSRLTEAAVGGTGRRVMTLDVLQSEDVLLCKEHDVAEPAAGEGSSVPVQVGVWDVNVRFAGTGVQGLVLGGDGFGPLVGAGGVPVAAPVGVTDDFGNTFEDATTVTLSSRGNHITGRIDYDGDHDWIRFSVPDSGYYTIVTDASLSIRVRLRDSTNTHMGAETASGNQTATIQALLIGGRYYYLWISTWPGDTGTGRYWINIHRIPSVPIKVYQSPRRPGLEADGVTVASDMGYNSKTRSQLRNLGSMGIPGLTGMRFNDAALLYRERIVINGPRTLKDRFRSIARVFTANNADMRQVALDMVAHFLDGSGADYRNAPLDSVTQIEKSCKKWRKML